MLKVVCQVEYTYMDSIKNRGVPIYQIGKILAADMAKFAILEIGIFEIVQIYLPIFLHAPII